MQKIILNRTLGSDLLPPLLVTFGLSVILQNALLVDSIKSDFDALKQQLDALQSQRAEMLEVLRTDYIRFARARGLTTRAIHFGHALKNTLVPVITITGLQLGALIAFAIITETVFQWPGMGLMFVQAVQNVDIPIMAAYLLMVSLIFVTINLVVDILYTVVDPRLRSTIGRPA